MGAVAEGKMKLTLVALCAVLLAYNVRALPVEGNDVGEDHFGKICIAGYCCDKEESIGEGLTVGEEEKNLKEILAPSATAGIEVGENLCMFGYCCEKEESTEDGLNVGEEKICIAGYCCFKKKEAA